MTVGVVSGSVGVNIPKMLQLFKSGHEYTVERDTYVYTQVGTVNLNLNLVYSNSSNNPHP